MPSSRLANPTKTVTVRQFDGGLNVVDSQLNLNPRFAPVLDNIMRGYDGSSQVRWGYQLVADISKALSGGVPIVKGNIIGAIFFQGYMVIATDQGELGKLQISTSILTVLWNNAIATSQSTTGWTNPTQMVTFYTFGGKLIAMNGINKPLQIDFTASPVCQYQFDPATSSNSAIPIAKYAAVMQAYAILGGEATTAISKPTQIDISAKLVASVYATNTSPADAYSADMSKLTPSTEANVTGLGVVRQNLVVTYRNGYSIGKLGIYNAAGTVHQPDFSDNIGQYGCVSGHTILTIGSDLLMCDTIGVSRLSPNNLGNALNPSRVSDYIEPMIQRNIARLSASTLEQKAFAVYNPKDKQYMLFMPKFDKVAIPLDVDPITFIPDNPTLMFVTLRAHDMAVGDPVTIAGSTAVGGNTAASINISTTIVAVPDPDTIAVQLPSAAIDLSNNGGGSAVTLTPTTDETIGYVLTYNPTLKIQSWSRFLGMSLSWGTTDVFGNLYIGSGTKVYLYGNPENPITGDAVDDYDYVYSSAHAVLADDVVLDVTTGQSWIANVSYTTTQATFAQERQLNPNNWQVFEGVPISFAWEWPWSDFGQRTMTKMIRAVHLDAEGAGSFMFSIFTDNLYREGKLGTLIPQRQMQFTAGMRGYGHGPQTFGGGRATAEEVFYPMPALCKLYKLRFEGATNQPLKFIAVTLLYNAGGIKR